MEHQLKAWPEYFDALEDGSKPFEVRRDDRPYAVGDTIVFRKFHPVKGYVDPEYMASFPREITYVLRGEEAEKWGVQKGFCVIGLSPAWELALCETEMVALHPDRPYIFRVYPDCKKCAEMAAVYE